LGIGGESIVFRKIINNKEKALKVAPVYNLSQNEEIKLKFEQTNISTSAYVNLQNFSKNNFQIVRKNPEFSSSNLKHENLIFYDNIVVDVVNGQFAFVIGKLKIGLI